MRRSTRILARDTPPAAPRESPRHAAALRRSSRYADLAEQKFRGKKILLLLATAMSTLRHVEPQSLRDATPSTPRDADLKLSATRRPPRRMTPI